MAMSAYLNELEMIWFRGLDRFVLTGLRPFTIIGGRNNVGKTTVLEAIYYLANRSVGVAPGKLLLSRKMSLRRRDLSSLFYQGNDDAEIMLSASFTDGVSRSLALERSDRSVVELGLEERDDGSVDGGKPSPVYAQQGTATLPDGSKSLSLSMLYFTKDQYKARDQELIGDKVHTGKAWNDKWKCHYYQTRVVANMSDAYKALFRLNRESLLLEALRLCDTRVVDLAFDGEQLLVGLGEGQSRLPLEVMGDGMVKIADIVTLIALSNAGDIVCVDEIENGLHHTVMRKFVESVARSARVRGVQIVATTHSREFLQQVAPSGDEEQSLFLNEEFAYLNVIRWEDGTIESIDYDYDQFSSAVEMGKEIR